MRSLVAVVCWIVLGGCSSKSAPEAVAELPVIPQPHAPLKLKPKNTVGGFRLELPKITLMPGEEISPCYAAPIVMQGPSRMVGGGVLRVGNGLHHGNVTTRPLRADSSDVVHPCGEDKDTALGGSGQDVIAGGSVLFGSTTQISGEEWQSFPDGMAFKVKDGMEIAARMHYLNAGKEPLEIAPVYEWFTIDESKVATELSPFFWQYPNFQIPPHSRYTVTARCPLASSMKIVTLMPHMHKLGVGYTAGFYGGQLDGKNFVETKGYDPDKSQINVFEPALDTAVAEGITFSCTWSNTFDKVIGEGIGDNEMCMTFGYGYPVGKVYTLSGTDGEICIAITAPP
ncbi:MAG: hypothetical protein ACXVEE_36165 [Polyangiales bacterium]